MIDYKEFIECNRGILIAPAGHGKTTAIADCLLQCPENSCMLILTHTHAGIASLRTKFHKKNVPSNRYQLETITGFAQRYVLSFLGSSVLPDEDETNYFSAAVEKCCVLMRSKVVQTILGISYNGVFVDEYQDCTIDQHNMIMSLAQNLPLHLLGDPLQGIFSFEQKPLVDIDKDLESFRRFDLLDYPWRWDKSNPALGKFILDLRHRLENGETIELRSNPSIRFYVNTGFKNEDEKIKCLGQIILNHECNSLLIICPSYRYKDRFGKIRIKGNLSDRIKIKQKADYKRKFIILDAIDSSEYYKNSKNIDKYLEKCRTSNRINKINWLFDILVDLQLSKTELRKWIDRDKNTFKHRTKENLAASEKLIELFDKFASSKDLSSLKDVIGLASHLPKMKRYHSYMLHTISKCFDIAQTNNISMFQAMKLFKTRIRHQGRTVEGECIGTTLLTKGLEFDTVIIWNADKFEDAKNFYVAISRACRKLFIITDSTTISFKQ